MNRTQTTLFAVFSVLLLLAVSPASAVSPGLDAASANSTEAELNSATTTNLTSTPYHDGALKLSYQSGEFNTVDDFESGELSRWTAGDWSIETFAETGTYSAGTSGTNAMTTDTSNLNSSIVMGDRVTWEASLSDPETVSYRVSVLDDTDDGYAYFYDASGPYRRVTLQKVDSGSYTTLAQEPDSVQISSGYVNGELILDNGRLYADISDDESQGSYVYESITAEEYEFEPTGDLRVEVDRVGSGSMNIDEMKTQEVAKSAQYRATHGVTDAQEASVNISRLAQADATITVEYDDGGTWTTGATQTVSSAQTVDLQLPDVSADQWRTTIDVSATGDDPQFLLAGEGIYFDSATPTISDVEPADGSYTETSTNLSATFSDADFGTVQGDTVTAEFVIDGSVVGSETLSAPGTASTLWNPATGGAKNYTVRVNDSYGNSAQTERTLNVPDQITLRNESTPSEILTGISGTAEVTFIGDGGFVTTRSVGSDGNISMNGLPADQTFVAVLDVDGYYPRRVVIDSLLQQQDIFLLAENSGVDVVEVDFGVDDGTGQFPPAESRLVVSKPVNLSGETDFRAIAGGRFGAVNSLPLFLEQDETYRLEIQNGEQTRAVGEYVANTPSRELIPIGSVNIRSDQEQGWAFDARIEQTDPAVARIVYADGEGATTRLQYTIEAQNGTTIYSVDESSSVNGYAELVSLPRANQTYTVNFTATRNGEEISGTREMGQPSGIAGQMPIDERWLSLISYVAVIAIGGLCVIVDGRLAAVGMTVTAVALTTLGFVSIPVPALGIAAAASLMFAAVGGRR